MAILLLISGVAIDVPLIATKPVGAVTCVTLDGFTDVTADNANMLQKNFLRLMLLITNHTCPHLSFLFLH